MATLCHVKLYWLSALNDVSYHDPRYVLLWLWIFYENQCNKLSIFLIFCVDLIDFVVFYERKYLAILCHAKLHRLSALNNVSYHNPRCVLLWSWIFYENQCIKLSIFFIFCVNLIDTRLYAVIFLVHMHYCTLTSNGLKLTEFLTPWLTLHIFLFEM